MRVVLPPTPAYDQVRDVITSGFVLGGRLSGYDSSEDALILDVRLEKRKLLVKRVVEELRPQVAGGVVSYGDGGLRVYPKLRIDSSLEGIYAKPLVNNVIVALDWRNLRYFTISELGSILRRIIESLGSLPEPSIGDARLIGHAVALLSAARLKGLGVDVRVIVVKGDEVLDSGVIASSVYRILEFVDEECLCELESLALDALQGVDTDVLEYLAVAIDNRDSFALRHMLRRMGCRVEADKLLTPADVLG